MDSGHRCVHVQRSIGRQQLPHRAELQFIQHKAQTVRHFVAIDQSAPEHFLAACVLGVVGVVEDFHGFVTCLGSSVPVPKQGKPLFALTGLEIMSRLDG
jgi:hypothetical protein